jgi:hyperosmotically inducible protein
VKNPRNPPIIAVIILLSAFAGAGSCAQAASETQAKASAAMAQAKDALIVVGVKARLLAADMDSATNVGVHVTHGDVVLSGVVRDPSEIPRLSNAAAGVSGVRSVETRLSVNRSLRPVAAQVADVALATEVMARLAAQTGINALSVKTASHDGHVTLSGGVHSATVKSLMVSTAAQTPGVKSVADHLEVKP